MRKVLAQFTDVLLILLLVAAAISAALWLVERDAALPYEAIAIFAIVILNAIMGYGGEAPKRWGSRWQAAGRIDARACG